MKNKKNLVSIDILIVLFFLLCSIVGCSLDDDSEDATSNLPTNQVILGPVENASISVFLLNDMENVIETTISKENGEFSLKLDNVDDNTLLLLTSTGGTDTDPDDDGIQDGNTVNVHGTIHAIASADKVKNGEIFITAISEIAWQYCKNMLDDIHPDDLLIRLNDISQAIFKNSINQENVTYNDILSFNPLSDTHRNHLTFQYESLLGDTSVISSIHEGSSADVLQNRITQLIGHELSFYAAKDQRYAYAKVQLVPFGKTKITSSSGNILYDPDSPDDNILTDYYPLGQVLNFQASVDDTHDLKNWNGCDEISTDNTKCTITITGDTIVSATSIYKETVLSDDIIDMSNVSATIENNTLYLQADPADDASIETLSNLSTGDIIVSSQQPYYIREIISIQQIENSGSQSVTSTTYQLETTDIDIEDIVQQGSGVLKKSLTHEDLENLTTVRSSRSPVQMLPPLSRLDKNFVFIFGNDFSRARDVTDTTSLVVSFPDNENPVVKVKGSFSLNFNLDFGIDFGLFSGLENIKIIPSVSLSESFEVEFIQNILSGEYRKKLVTLNFADQIVMIGVVPVWISYQAPVELVVTADVDGKASVNSELSQTILAGVQWSQDHGLKWVDQFDMAWNGVEGELKAELDTRAYIQVTPQVMIYRLIGPGIPVDTGIKFVASAVESINPDLQDVELAAIISFFASAKVSIRAISSDSKIVRKIQSVLNNASITIQNEKEWKIKEWRYNLISSGLLPPFLEVSGDNIYLPAIPKNESDSLQGTLATYQLSNSGDEPLTWRINSTGSLSQYIKPDTVWGTLQPDEEITVNIVWQSYFNPAELEIGKYDATISFINESRISYPDSQSGSTKRNISFEIAPQMNKPTLTSVHYSGTDVKKINLSWNYTYSDIYQFPDKFHLFRGLTNDNNCSSSIDDEFNTNQWEKVYTFDESFIGPIAQPSEPIQVEYRKTVNAASLHLQSGTMYCWAVMCEGRYSFSGKASNVLKKWYVEGQISGIVKDAVSGNPISDAYVTVFQGDEFIITIPTDSSGSYDIQKLLPNTNYHITISKDNYNNIDYHNIEVIGEQTTYLETILQLEETIEQQGNAEGYVYNALDGTGIDGIDIALRQGINVTEGEIVATATTNSTGFYSIENLPFGNYTGEIVNDDYLTNFFTITCIGGQTTKNNNTTISPILTEDQIRIILTWGDTPDDLDSHFTGPLADGERFHLYWLYAEYCPTHDDCEGSPWPDFVRLDIDDTEQEGPETITLDKQQEGTYRYSVHDFSNRKSTDSLALANSNARVKIYKGDQLISTFNCPNKGGTLWTVFEIVNQELIPINTMTYTENAGDITRSKDLHSDLELILNLPPK